MLRYRYYVRHYAFINIVLRAGAPRAMHDVSWHVLPRCCRAMLFAKDVDITMAIARRYAFAFCRHT